MCRPYLDSNSDKQITKNNNNNNNKKKKQTERTENLNTKCTVIKQLLLIFRYNLKNRKIVENEFEMLRVYMKNNYNNRENK